MSGFYTVAYAVGFRPWERAGREAAEQLGELLDREAKDRSVPPGQAVDLGCGTGTHTIELAHRGWRATGIDNQPRALRAARARAAGSPGATFVQADVTALSLADTGSAADFFLDVGCFHGLTAPQRRAMAAGVSATAAPDATFLLLAFSPGRRGLLPAGAGRAEIETVFSGWTVIADEPADVSGMPHVLQGSAPRWYRLRLNQG